MPHTYHRTMARSNRVYRSRKDKVLSGVCGGLAKHFEISSAWLRAGFIVGFLIQPPIILILYVVAIFIMPLDMSEDIGSATSHARKKAQSKAYSKQFRTHEEVARALDDQFDQIEAKIRKLEDHVTSRDYVLNREFEEL